MDEWFGCMQGHALLSLCQLTFKHSRQAYIFTFINVYQGLFPRMDGLRLCVYDSPLSNPLIGRSLATVAEIAFAEQLEKYTNVPGLEETAFVANWLCWLGILTGFQPFHVFEKALWMITCMRIVLSHARLDARTAAFLGFLYLWTVIPTYAARESNLVSMDEGFRRMQTCEKNTDWSVETAIWMAVFNIGGGQLSLYMG